MLDLHTLENKIELSNALDSCVTYLDKCNPKNPSIIGGKGGIVLAYSYLYLYYPSKGIENKLTQNMEECLSSLTDLPLNASLADGFVGVSWLFQHLINIGIYDDESINVLDDIDVSISNSILLDVEQKNYDLLYGLVGKGIYFLERLAVKDYRKEIERIVLGLEKFSIKDENGIFWADFFTEKPKEYKLSPCYNYGMAHGIPAIISFLSKVHQEKILTKKTEFLIDETVKWLFKKEKLNSYSFYTHTSFDNESSRLAWCYGDLSIAIALFHASKALSNDSYYKQAMKIALNSSKRDLTQSKVFFDQNNNLSDPGFCHGSGGNAFIFNEFYKLTAHPEFKIASNYWRTIMLNSYDLTKSTSGFLTLLPSNELDIQYHWGEDYSLLEGVSGITLILLSLYKDINPSWARIFFLDF